MSFLLRRIRPAVLLTALIAFATVMPDAAAQENGQSSDGRKFAYTIAPTDRLRIAVFQETDLSVISRVDSKGNINLPLTGEVNVIGLTIPEAQRRIERAYREGRFLRDPQVTINVEEYAPRVVSVLGEVRNPGQLTLPVESGMTVLDAINKCGGFTDIAKGTAVTITRRKPDGTKTVMTIDVQSYIRGSRDARVEDTMLMLLPGDTVYVPQRLI